MLHFAVPIVCRGRARRLCALRRRTVGNVVRNGYVRCARYCCLDNIKGRDRRTRYKLEVFVSVVLHIVDLGVLKGELDWLCVPGINKAGDAIR